MDAACIAWDTALPFPSRPFVSLLFLPPLPTHPTPLSPPAHSSGVCLFLPVAVLLQLSPLLWFCFVACCAWWCLLFCVPGLGSCVLSPPAFPPFLSLFGLLVVCSLCLFSAFVVLSFVSPLFVVAGCPCSLPSFPLPPLVCVCQYWQTFSQQIYSDYTDKWTSAKVLKVKRKFQHFVISCFASSVDDSSYGNHIFWTKYILIGKCSCIRIRNLLSSFFTDGNFRLL